jgi:hypothetical protein
VGSLVVFVALIPLGVLFELYRARARRRYVESFVASRGWTLKACRHRWALLEPNWLVSYRVDVIDATGHEMSGIAYATGFLRRKAWIDW